MTKQDFYRYKARALILFGKRIIRNESSDARREIAYRLKHETTFSSLPAAIITQLSSEDKYDLESRIFHVQGKIPVMVIDGMIAQALSQLIAPLRDVILLHYFLDLNLSEIALLLKIPYTTVQYRFITAHTRLKEIVEGLLNEYK